MESNKKELRKQILTMRGSIRPEDKIRYDAQIKERILTHRIYREAEIILAYASYRSEVDTLVLINRALTDGKDVFVPKVAGCEMEFWQIWSLDDLQSGYRGIPEPIRSISLPERMRAEAGAGNGTDPAASGSKTCHAMMWMPGAVFDIERHRIGYGGGYYDRYLGGFFHKRESGQNAGEGDFRLTTAALAYSCQVVGQVPHEKHDVRPELIFTEKGIL